MTALPSLPATSSATAPAESATPQATATAITPTLTATSEVTPTIPQATPAITLTMTATPKQTRQSITGPRKLDRGQQGFFYACNFPNPAVLTAELIGEQGAQTLPVLRAAPDPAHPLGSAQGVVVWNIVCNQASGDYTLTIRDQGGHSEDYTFEVRSPNPTTHAEPERILVIPAVGLPGTTFEVYYCGYEERVGRLVEIDFFHFVAVEGDKQIFHRAAGWSVVIDSTGWSRQEIVSVPGDPARPYALRDRETGLSGSSRFWLAP